MNKKIVFGLLYELLWFLIAALVAYILIWPIRDRISDELFNYLLPTYFLIFTYFRFIAFMQQSILLESIWSKILFFVLNFPLFFFMLNKSFEYGQVADTYIYTLPKTILQHIKSGTELPQVMYVKRLVTIAEATVLTLIILFQLRIVHSIFKFRQLDKVIYIKKNVEA